VYDNQRADKSLRLVGQAALPVRVDIVAKGDLMAERTGTPLLVHNVYFALHDKSAAARSRLVEACRKYLSTHPGTRFFAVGTLADELKRPVNDRDFDVGLHVIFESQAAHDQYQDHPQHHQFIDENKANWKKVRVFDSRCEWQ
jgi:hypothetical protein